MTISQKCQYAVRSILELAKRHGQGPVVIGDIAAKQAVPPRFLEIILNEMKQGGFVQSRRGVQGGYMLARAPGEITVGEVIRFVDGPFDPVQCLDKKNHINCPLDNGCSLMELWTRAKQALESVYDNTTFQDLMEREQALRKVGADYVI